MEQVFTQQELQQIEKQNLTLTKASSLKSTFTNIAYNLKNNCIFQLPFSSRTPLAFSSDQKQVCLLGKSYTQDSRDMFYNDFEKIIWFSYRRLEQFEDVGWGCMIRVIQMLVAQAITRDQTDMHPDKIIDLFREEKEGPLALSKICKAGQIGARWTSCPEILSVVASILSDLKNQQKLNFSFQIYCDQLELASCQQEDFPKLVTIHTTIGQQKTINQDFIFHLALLSKDRRFVGMASGQKNQALYVVGTFGKKAVILDPHYVQEKQSFGTFFCRNPQGIDFTQLASGVSISFYIPNLEQYEDWAEQIKYMHRLSAPYNCFRLKMTGEQDWTFERRKGSDDFQLL